MLDVFESLVGPGEMRLEDLNALAPEAAARELLRCCGSARWAREMAMARPFADLETTVRRADAIWASLTRADWLEAFAAHPKIGEKQAGEAGGSGGTGKTGGADGDASWSALEQRGVARAPEEVRERLARANRDYEARFGYIFIVCATGRSAEEMLSLLEGRLANDASSELFVAAEEQRRITGLRLAKLME